LPTRWNCHHVLLRSRSGGGFGVIVCHLGGAAALPMAAGSKPNVDTSMPMTDRSARLYVPA
jgi:acetate kinase